LNELAETSISKFISKISKIDIYLKYGESEIKILTQSNTTKNRLRDSQRDTPVYTSEVAKFLHTNLRLKS